MIPPSLLEPSRIEPSPGPQPETGSEPGVLIVGAGQAGVQTAEALRSGGYAAPSPCWARSHTRPTTGRRCPKLGCVASCKRPSC